MVLAPGAAAVVEDQLVADSKRRVREFRHVAAVIASVVIPLFSIAKEDFRITSLIRKGDLFPVEAVATDDELEKRAATRRIRVIVTAVPDAQPAQPKRIASPRGGRIVLVCRHIAVAHCAFWNETQPGDLLAIDGLVEPFCEQKSARAQAVGVLDVGSARPAKTCQETIRNAIVIEGCDVPGTVHRAAVLFDCPRSGDEHLLPPLPMLT